MSYCKHGGVCIFKDEHTIHFSGYCLWNDNKGLSKEEADKILIQKMGNTGRAIALIENVLLKKLEDK